MTGISSAIGSHLSAKEVSDPYKSPPVHEVVLSLHFREAVRTADLEALPHKVKGWFAVANKRERTEVAIEIGPSGQQVSKATRRFDGWQFSDTEKTRVVQTAPARLSLHAVRPGTWPTGKYAGWNKIREEMLSALALFGDLYGERSIAKAAIRYLNRIAIPKGTDLSDWLTIVWRGPQGVRDPHAFNLRQTWGRIDGADDLSATVGLALIEIPESEALLRETAAGLLLDLEVFNLRVSDAPKFEQLAEWTARAHSVENILFEDSVTNALRATWR